MLRLKPKKCHILKTEVQYLGHVVSSEGIRPDPAKVEKVMTYAVPADMSDVRRFLGVWLPIIDGSYRILQKLLTPYIL